MKRFIKTMNKPINNEREQREQNEREREQQRLLKNTKTIERYSQLV